MLKNRVVSFRRDVISRSTAQIQELGVFVVRKDLDVQNFRRGLLNQQIAAKRQEAGKWLLTGNTQIRKLPVIGMIKWNRFAKLKKKDRMLIPSRILAIYLLT